MRKWTMRALLLGAGYALGRSYAQAWLDRASPEALREQADISERHGYNTNRRPSRRFELRRIGAGTP